MSIHYDTFTFEQDLQASPRTAFAAYIDTKMREKWSAPNLMTQVCIIDSDVRTGGSETAKCGPVGGDLRWHLDVAYHLVEDGKLISFTEVLKEGPMILTAALVTFDFRQSGAETTHLRVTDQATSFVGKGGLEGHSEGYANALRNLAGFFGEESQHALP